MPAGHLPPLPLILAASTYFVLINFITWHVWVDDKRRASRRDRRTPENTLLWLSLLGGWPGALMAAKQFRHKTAKRAFLSRFWPLVALNVTAVIAIVIVFGL